MSRNFIKYICLYLCIYIYISLSFYPSYVTYEFASQNILYISLHAKRNARVLSIAVRFLIVNNNNTCMRLIFFYPLDYRIAKYLF